MYPRSGSEVKSECGGDLDNIPAELRARPQWVGWKLTTRDGKPTKVPVNPATGGNADPTDPATWGTFEAAVAGVGAGRWRGVGFVFTENDPYTGIDWDKIINPDTGEIDPAAAEEIDSFASYAEESQSGTGVHVIIRGKLPGKGRNKRGRECYDRSRFFVMTGKRWNDRGVEDRQEVLDRWLIATFGEDKPKPPDPAPTDRKPLDLSDNDILAKIRRSAQAAKFAALWRGDTSGYGGDDSAADLALCNIFAWWTAGGAAAVDRLFRASGLMRAKWDRKTGNTTYGGLTVAKACAGVGGGGYDPNYQSGATPTFGGTADAEPKKGAEIILDYFRRAYRPVFRSGNVVHCEDGSEVIQSVACAGASSKLIALLATASDAPTFKGGGVNDGLLPGFFRKWAPTAWADMRDALPDEDDAELGADAPAAEEFRRLVREAMLTEITLGDRDEGGRGLPAERLAVIEWCRRFAKPEGWKSIRSKLVYCRCEMVGNELRLHVAIHHGLFSQLIGADRRLKVMSTDKFNKRCAKYGVGRVKRDERVGGERMVILSDGFVNELVGMLSGSLLRAAEVDRAMF